MLAKIVINPEILNRQYKQSNLIYINMIGHPCSKHKEELERYGLIRLRNTNFYSGEFY